MKNWIFLLLIILSCNKMTTKPIEVISVIPATGEEMAANNLSGNSISVTIESAEDFSAINSKMSFGFVCVKDEKDFELSQEELAKKHLVFDVVQLTKIQPDRYQFFINANAVLPNKSVFCRLERPGFVLTEGYKSDLFEIKLP